MKTIPASIFRAQCLALLDQVASQRETVVITKRGKPIAKLVPIEEAEDSIYNFLAGKGAITEDVLAPALNLEEWGHLR